MREASMPVDAVERGDDHLVPDLGRRDHPVALLPRVAGDHHEHPVEVELMAGGGRVHQVPDVHRIEGAAEDPDPLGRAVSDAFGAGGDTGRVYGERCVKGALRTARSARS